MKAVLVVAHPDDESLWFGGMLVRYAEWDWTVVCSTVPRKDSERAELKFLSACDALGVKAELLGIEETGARDPLPPEELLYIHEFVQKLKPDLVVTHGPVGEYGHLHHIQLSQWLRQRWVGRIAVNRYATAELALTATLEGASEPVKLELTEREWNRKLLALKCYDHTSPLDSEPKWQALLNRYGPEFNLRVEPYEGLPAVDTDGS